MLLVTKLSMILTATSEINSFLAMLPPEINIVMIPAAESIRSEAGLTNLVLCHVRERRLRTYECRPWLERDFEYAMRVLILGSQIEELRGNPLCHA